MGEPGNGGSGGMEASDGQTITVEYVDIVYDNNTITYGLPDIISKDVITYASGKDGVQGQSSADIEYPYIVKAHEPSHIINSYKQYAREFISKNTPSTDLKIFLEEIDKNERIQSLYDTLSLVDELQCLENNYFHLRQDISFIPFYESLLSRVSHYAHYFSESIESKKVLNFLITTILTKLDGMKNYDIPIFDVVSYFDKVREQIIKLRQAESQMIIIENDDKYEKYLNQNVESATEFIKANVLPEIEQIFNSTNEKILGWLYEVHSGSRFIFNMDPPDNETLTDPGAPEDYEPDLDSDLDYEIKNIWEEILTDAENSMIEMKSSIRDGWASDDIERNKIVFANYIHLPEKLNTFIPFMGKDLKKKYEIFVQELSDIKQNFDDFSTEKLNVSKQHLVGINRIKAEMMDEMSNDAKIDYMIEQLYEFLNEMYDIRNHFSEEIRYFYKKNYLKVKYVDENNVTEMSNGSIYNIKVSLYRNFEEAIYEFYRNLTEKTIETNIHTVRIQNNIEDIKIDFKSINSEYREIIVGNIEKLDKVINFMIYIYNRIASYRNKMKMVTNIGNMVYGKQQQINDSQLNIAVFKLKYTIQMNIFLQSYEILIDAFKQHYFPFAHMFLRNIHLPIELQLNDTKSLTDRIIEQIGYVEEKIKLSGISKYKSGVFEDVDFKNESILGPFYKWNNNEIKNEIDKLLQGEEITVTADIMERVDLNALKFNEIGIELKIGKEDAQEQLNIDLENFGVTMTMVGKNYYRCNTKIYCMPIDKDIVIDYSFKKRPDGKPYIMNSIYKTIYKNDYFLSPYTTWKIKLYNFIENNTQNESTNFSKLSRFAEEPIYLQLVGRGQYFSNGPLSLEVCDDESYKFYDSCGESST